MAQPKVVRAPSTLTAGPMLLRVLLQSEGARKLANSRRCLGVNHSGNSDHLPPVAVIHGVEQPLCLRIRLTDVFFFASKLDQETIALQIAKNFLGDFGLHPQTL